MRWERDRYKEGDTVDQVLVPSLHSALANHNAIAVTILWSQFSTLRWVSVGCTTKRWGNEIPIRSWLTLTSDSCVIWSKNVDDILVFCDFLFHQTITKTVNIWQSGLRCREVTRLCNLWRNVKGDEKNVYLFFFFKTQTEFFCRDKYNFLKTYPDRTKENDLMTLLSKLIYAAEGFATINYRRYYNKIPNAFLLHASSHAYLL